MSQTIPQQSLLSGVRILDLSQYEAGPTCTLLLALLGAEVIKVESPKHGGARRRLFHNKGNKEDLYFVLMNLNKKSVALDLDGERGRAVFHRLLDQTDVLVENVGSRRRSQLSLDDPSLLEKYPKLILASVSGYGTTGPYAHFPSLDMTAQAMGGIMSLTGEEGGLPLRCGATVADASGGAYLALGIAAALYRRTCTGRGGKVEVTLQEAAINLGRSLLGTHIAYGSPAPRLGNQLRDVTPWDLYQARNGYVAICAISNHAFSRLMEIIEADSNDEGRKIPSIEERIDHREEIDRKIGAWVAARDKFEVMETLAAENIPCGAVLDSTEIARNEHVRAGGFLQEIDHPDWGRLTVLGSPIRVDNAAPPVACSPLLGESTAEILRLVLGMSDVELNSLAEEDVIA